MLRKGKNSAPIPKGRKIRKYGQTKPKHARRGVIACSVAGMVLLSVILLLAAAYVTKGQVGGIIGSIGILAASGSICGMVSAVKGFREREKRYITCKLGLTANILLFVGFILLFLRGLF